MKKQTLSAILCFALVLCMTSASWSGDNDILIDQLGLQNAAARNDAYQNLVNQGPSALGDLLKQVGSENKLIDKFAKRAVEFIVNQSTAPGADAEQAAVENALILFLLDDATSEQLKFALWMLSRTGTEKAVPAIAIFLQRPDTFETARYALERIPVPASSNALLIALSEAACPKCQSGLIKTLGAHGDPIALKPILKAFKHPDHTVRIAAIAAAGRLNDIQAIKPLIAVYQKGYARIKTAAAESLIVLTESLIESGEFRRIPMIIELLAQDDEAHIKCASLRLLVKFKKLNAWPDLVMALNSPCPQMRGMAEELLMEMTCSTMTQNIIDAVQFASGDAKIAMVRILRARNIVSF